MQQIPGKLANNSTATFKTGSLQQTENYIWNTADVLGKGATAVVYFGRHKSSGDVSAVKVFHDRASRHMFPTRQREIETLRTLQHDNIVKLIALETEVVTGNEVLVMEYCSGSSLYAMLDQPQYAFGFPEDEFLLFLRHIADGMKYLRSQGYIHRDIKPGNIMRFIAEDGRSVYKICDFGAARELQDDETFMSIYGTEEYLYPKMYEQAVLRRPGIHEFDASVDLWSLGVTLYHVATGQLPFQPFGGRSNSTTMHLITSRKPSGAISGIQTSANGQIQWSHTLPDTCQLSEYLQKVLVSMLAGLIEIDPRKMWNFEQFFGTVHNLDNKLTLKIFSCCTAQDILLYVDRSDTFTKLQDRLAEITELSAGNQLIMWHDQLLSDVIIQTEPVQTYPKSVINSRLYLINKTSTEQCVLKMTVIPNFPDISPGIEHLELDALTAKKAAAVAYRISSVISTTLEQQKRIAEGEMMFRVAVPCTNASLFPMTAEVKYAYKEWPHSDNTDSPRSQIEKRKTRRFIKRIVWHSEIIVPGIQQRLEETRMHQESFSKTFNLMLELFNTLDSIIHVEEMMSSKVGTVVQLKDTIGQLSDCLRDDSLNVFYDKINTRLGEITVYVQVLSRRIAEQELERFNAEQGCTEEDHCTSKADTFKHKIASVAATMSKHRKYGDLHSHEQFIHKCEKQKLQEYTMYMWSLSTEHCTRNLQTCFKSSLRELGNLIKHLTRTKKVEQNITSVKDSLAQLSEKLFQKETKCRGIIERIKSLLEKTLGNKAKTKPSPLVTGDIKNIPSGTEAVLTTRSEGIRSELPGQASVNIAPGQSSARDYSSTPKRQRTELLDKLTRELLSLKTDSDELKNLVVESGAVMKQFLSETSSLKIEGSLDSDQRRIGPDDT